MTDATHAAERFWTIGEMQQALAPNRLLRIKANRRTVRLDVDMGCGIELVVRGTTVDRAMQNALKALGR